jgi:hypothetical protein
MSENSYLEGQVTTSSNIFRTEDITHKPKRMQGDFVKREKVSGDANLPVEAVPSSVTLEGAIKYYEENSKGELAKLYSFTAMVLKTCRKNKRKDAVSDSNGKDSMNKVDLINSLNSEPYDEVIMCSMDGEPSAHDIVAVERPEEGTCVIIIKA